MSWDIDLTIDTGGPTPAVLEWNRNLTWNNGPILTELGIMGLRGFDVECGTWIETLQRARHRLETEETTLSKLGPSNGWGGTRDCLNFITGLLKQCYANPKAKVRWR